MSPSTELVLAVVALLAVGFVVWLHKLDRKTRPKRPAGWDELDRKVSALERDQETLWQRLTELTARHEAVTANTARWIGRFHAWLDEHDHRIAELQGDDEDDDDERCPVCRLDKDDINREFALIVATMPESAAMAQWGERLMRMLERYRRAKDGSQ